MELRGSPVALSTLPFIAEALFLPWIGHILPVVLGGAGGYLVYRVIGCRTGACPLTSNPWISTLYGALIGALLL